MTRRALNGARPDDLKVVLPFALSSKEISPIVGIESQNQINHWQFKGEKVGVPCTHGQGINCFGLISRQNHLVFTTTEHTINADFVVEQLERFSLGLKKQTVVVLDNAKVHTSRKVKERLVYWQNRGLNIFYLPPYCPHLNIIGRLWLELKARWLKPQDYICAQSLFLATILALGAVGKELFTQFIKYNFAK